MLCSRSLRLVSQTTLKRIWKERNCVTLFHYSFSERFVCGANTVVDTNACSNILMGVFLKALSVNRVIRLITNSPL